MKNRLKLGDYIEWNIEGFNVLEQTVYDEELKPKQVAFQKIPIQRLCRQSGKNHAGGLPSAGDAESNSQ